VAPWLRGSVASAFSMPELMIALVILGIGLLFIAAALPVGIEYSRRTVDLSAAEAVGEHALATIETQVRTARKVVHADPINLANVFRVDQIFRPRAGSAATPAAMTLRNDWEPVVKVRPLVTENVGFTAPQRGKRVVEPTEPLVQTFVSGLGLGNDYTSNNHLEFDLPFPSMNALSLLESPALPGIARVYPPIEPITTFKPEDFLGLPGGNVANYPTFAPRPTNSGYLSTDIPDRERSKAFDRRVAWTAFYRRVSYADGSDPLLYEVIVVVTRRPSENHRFAAQDGGAPNWLLEPRAVASNFGLPIGGDRLLPSAWLVAFTEFPSPMLVQGSDYGVLSSASGRFLRPPTLGGTFTERSRLAFKCNAEVGRLLPVGSVFIPSRNDHDLDGLTTFSATFGRQVYGFTPHQRDTLPIYEVVERPDDETVVVKSNGVYPWVLGDNEAAAPGWPVWVIPPAFVERDSNGQPIFERQSPIVTIIRKTIRLHEFVE